ncbi:MAG: outer membrane beta-barrel protein [Ignavibacteriae bacterium]|nr:outer membrane beta-barrel protein [Ignavibacteriota bacterium]
MKNLLVVVALIGLVAFSANAQGKISFGVGVDFALPMSSGFSDSQNFGIGGTAKVYYPFNDMITFTGTAGYITFSGKDYTVFGTTVKAGSWNMIPVVVGGRYYFMPATASMRFYGAFDMGLIFGSYTTPDQVIFGVKVSGGSVSTTDFTYQPAVGFEASKFDVAVRLLGVSGATCVAARVGYIFN